MQKQIQNWKLLAACPIQIADTPCNKRIYSPLSCYVCLRRSPSSSAATGGLGHSGFDFGDPFGGRELASAAGGSREPAGWGGCGSSLPELLSSPGLWVAFPHCSGQAGGKKACNFREGAAERCQAGRLCRVLLPFTSSEPRSADAGLAVGFLPLWKFKAFLLQCPLKRGQSSRVGS